MNKFKITLLLSLGLILTLSACSLDVVRNPDGSLTVESAMTESDLQKEINAAILDPLIQEFTVDIKSGYAEISADRKRLKGSEVDTLRFNLALRASEGQLVAEISEATLNDMPFDPDRVELWNQRIAARLERASRRNPNTSLETVTMAEDSLGFEWLIKSR